MKYELNIKMDNGKLHTKTSGEIEFLGIKFKVKEYEIIGDLNETLDKLATLLEGTEKESGIFMLENIAQMLGLKKETVTRLKSALVSKM